MASDEHSDFAHLLRRARRAAGLTQEQLAGRSGMSARGISDLERGVRRAPRKSTIDLLADALRLTLEERASWERARSAATRRAPRSTSATEPAQEAVPRPLTTFVGRERELAEIRKRLADPAIRLLTLTGTGGIGKTRLASEAARAIVDLFPDGVAFVSLAAVRDTALVPATIAEAFDVRSAGNQPVLDVLRTTLGPREMLLVLDNLEHVLEAGLYLSTLLEDCPRLTILATSRVRLGLRAEHEYRLVPLSLPTPDRPSISAVQNSAAAQLLLDRGRNVDSDLTITGDNAPSIAEICVRLDGLPLAIELAAVWLRLLSPEELAARLDQRLPMLSGGLHDLPDRQRSLRDTIQWSYDLLDNDDHELLHRLSIFVGGWSTERAAQVTGRDEIDVLNGMRRLNDHNLIGRLSPAGVQRFEMLEVIREFCLEQLAGSGELADARQRHADCFLRVAEQTEAAVLGAPTSAPLDGLDLDLGNLRAAFEWFVDQRQAEAALRMVSDLQWYWIRRASLAEADKWLDGALALERSVPDDVLARAMNAAGIVASYRGDAATSRERHNRALELFRSLDDEQGIAYALHGLARAASITDDWSLARDLNEQSLEIFRRVGEWIGIAGAAANLADAIRALNQNADVSGLLSEALEIASQHNDWAFQSICLNQLGEQALVSDDLERATEFAVHSLSLNREMRTSRHSINGLELRAAIACRRGEPELAATLFGAAASMRHRIDFPVTRTWPYRAEVEVLEQLLGKETFDKAWGAGERQSLADAIDLALAFG